MNRSRWSILLVFLSAVCAIWDFNRPSMGRHDDPVSDILVISSFVLCAAAGFISSKRWWWLLLALCAIYIAKAFHDLPMGLGF
jgi:hypothetical protein